MGCCFSGEGRGSASDEPSSASAPPPVTLDNCVNCRVLNAGNLSKVTSSSCGSSNAEGSICCSSCSIDQDTSYWEVEINEKSMSSLTLGVYDSAKLKSLESLQKALAASPASSKDAGHFSVNLEVKKGDVVGCQLGLDDYPALVFRINGLVVSDHVTKVSGAKISPFFSFRQTTEPVPKEATSESICVAFSPLRWKFNQKGAMPIIKAVNLV